MTMYEEFQYAYDTVDRAASFRDIYDAIKQCVLRYGYEHFLLFISVVDSYVSPTSVQINNLPSRWIESYRQRSFWSIDPTLKHAERSSLPMIWGGSTALGSSHAKLEIFLHEACEAGLTSGITFPLRGVNGEWGFFNCSSWKEPTDLAPQIAEHLPYLHLLSKYAFEKTIRLAEQQGSVSTFSRLSIREDECLKWSAEGKTAWEISRILGISERTVVFHLNNAGAKLNACNRVQAMARYSGRHLYRHSNPGPGVMGRSIEIVGG